MCESEDLQDANSTKCIEHENERSLARENWGSITRIAFIQLTLFTQPTTLKRLETKERTETWTRLRSQKTHLTQTTTETCPPKPPRLQSSTSLSLPPLHRPSTIHSPPHPMVPSPSNQSPTIGYSLATMLKYRFVAICVFEFGTSGYCAHHRRHGRSSTLRRRLWDPILLTSPML